MPIRSYQSTDLPAVQRIWRECGWIESDAEAARLEDFFADAIGSVGTIDDVAESAATVHLGDMCYDGTDIRLAGVTSVTTSLIGRKQGLAKAATIDCMAKAAREGAAVAVLGIFEQGFYDLLGFGSGPYSVHYQFDPATLNVEYPKRTPVRLTLEDNAEIHETFRNRKRSHGGLRLDSAALRKAELGWETPHFALGYRDSDGALTHFLWGKTQGESGPYRVEFLSYRNDAELMELLGLLRSIGDQVRAVDMMEPREIQIQDLVRHPNRQRIVTRRTDYQVGGRVHAWWQARILDLEACVAARRWMGDPLRFNLELHDPVSGLDSDWPGLGGTYVVEVGESSHASAGGDSTVPTLQASVNAFSRLWLGARSATSLSLTTDLKGPTELLDSLDEAFHLPTPHTGIYL